MNYQNIFHDNMLNGEGLRVVLWVSGCSNNCPGCHNPQTHDPKSGKLFNKKAKEEIYSQLRKPYIAGITLSGGDPLYEGNIEEITKLVKDIKIRFPQKTIWLYTGSLFENVQNLEMFQANLIDVLVDGMFILSKYNKDLKWVGSTNQRVIDVKKSLKEGNVILYESI